MREVVCILLIFRGFSNHFWVSIGKKHRRPIHVALVRHEPWVARSEFVFVIATPQVIIMADEYPAAMISMSIFRIRAELDCPRCKSANVDKKFQHMGEYFCRHCKYFWKTV